MGRYGDALRPGPENRYHEIIRQYGLMLLKDPHSRVFVSMADTCLRAGMPKMALQVVQKGLTHHPRLRAALTLKGRILMRLGRTDEARRILSEVASADPENILARKLLAEIHMNAGEPDQGAARLAEVQRIWSGNSSPAGVSDGEAPRSGEGDRIPEAGAGGEDKRMAEAIETLERWLNNANKLVKG